MANYRVRLIVLNRDKIEATLLTRAILRRQALDTLQKADLSRNFKALFLTESHDVRPIWQG